MLNLSSILGALGSAKGELTKMRNELGALQRRQEDLRNLPLPRDELADLVCRLIDQEASAYPECLASALRHYIHNPLQRPLTSTPDDGSPSIVPVTLATTHTSVPPGPRTMERSLFYLLRDPIKAGARKAIMEMPYPDKVGPRMADRMKELERVGKEIPTLTAKIAELENGLRGVSAEVES